MTTTRCSVGARRNGASGRSRFPLSESGLLSIRGRPPGDFPSIARCDPELLKITAPARNGMTCGSTSFRQLHGWSSRDHTPLQQHSHANPCGSDASRDKPRQTFLQPVDATADLVAVRYDRSD